MWRYGSAAALQCIQKCGERCLCCGISISKVEASLPISSGSIQQLLRRRQSLARVSVGVSSNARNEREQISELLRLSSSATKKIYIKLWKAEMVEELGKRE